MVVDRWDGVYGCSVWEEPSRSGFALLELFFEFAVVEPIGFVLQPFNV